MLIAPAIRDLSKRSSNPNSLSCEPCVGSGSLSAPCLSGKFHFTFPSKIEMLC